MAAHALLKNEFTEDEKCHNLTSWLNLCGIGGELGRIGMDSETRTK